VAVMAALFATLHRTWAWDILRPFRTAEGTVARGLPSAWPVQVVVASQPISWYMLSGERVARASILVRSLPAGLSLVQVGYDVRTDTAGSYARGDLDRGIRSRDVLSLSEPAGIPSPWQAALQCPAGLAQRQAGEGVTGRVEIFRQTTLDGRPWPGRVHGILRFLVVRPRVREAVTIGDTGARLGLGPSRVYAHHVSDRDAATGLALRTERLYVFPFPPRDARTNVMLAFFDPATGDCIVPTTHGKTIGALSLPVVAVDWSVTEWRRVGGRGPSEVGPVPDGLQLAVVENEVIGTLEAPFEVTLPALADNRAL